MSLATLPARGSVGEFKQGFQTADHQGWILMNGRAVAGLLAGQRARAAVYGWNANLPNLTGQEWIDGGAAAFGTATNVDSVVLTRPQLPTGVVLTGGTLAQVNNNHDHPFNTQASARLARNGALIQPGNNNAGPFNFVVAQGGAHNHPVPVQLGSDAPVSLTNPYLSANPFVFLGTT